MKQRIHKAWQMGVRQTQQRRTLLLYGLIGLSGATLDVIIFALLVHLGHMNPVIATIISTSGGIANNFVLNALFNFRKRDHLLWRFVSFYTVGAAGLIASALMLLIASDIFSADPTWVKLLSIPPIVLGQYLLNKHVSFSDRIPTVRSVIRTLRPHRALLAINFVFLLLAMSLVILTPMRTDRHGAPDEYQHFGKNVDFMIQNHRLPIAGQDDKDALAQCRVNNYGQVPCLYSYQFHPGFNYVVSAVTTKVGGVVGLGGYTGARLASVMWGLVFINAIYLIARLFLRRNQSLALMGIIGFIPQVIFTASYVNQDIHSLAIAAMLVYTSVGYLYFGRQKLRWLFYIFFGLLFVAKYNYFITALVPLLLLGRSWRQDRAWQPVMKHLGWMALTAVVLSSFWYIRNLLLYHDPLGQTFILNEMAKYHELGIKWSMFDIHSYALLFKLDFLDTLFKSFFATFGYMFSYLEGAYYAVTKLVLFASAALLIYFGGKKVRRWLLLLGGFILIALFQVIFNSFTYDFQAQGRYMFVILPVAALVLAIVLQDIDKRRPWLVRGLLLAVLTTIGWLLWQSILVIGVAYGSAV